MAEKRDSPYKPAPKIEIDPEALARFRVALAARGALRGGRGGLPLEDPVITPEEEAALAAALKKIVKK